MSHHRSLAILITSIAIVGLLASGCSTNSQAIETERLLAAAGFQMRLADTPDKLTRLTAQPQRTLVPHNQDGKIMYSYADAKVCKCIYVGTERAYGRYQKLALVHEDSVRRLQAAQYQEDAAMDMSTWGPWGPWWY